MGLSPIGIIGARCCAESGLRVAEFLGAATAFNSSARVTNAAILAIGAVPTNRSADRWNIHDGTVCCRSAALPERLYKKVVRPLFSMRA